MTAASMETEAVAMNAVLRFVVYVTPEERKGPSAFPIILAEFSAPKVNPLSELLAPASPRRYDGGAD